MKNVYEASSREIISYNSRAAIALMAFMLFTLPAWLFSQTVDANFNSVPDTIERCGPNALLQATINNNTTNPASNVRAVIKPGSGEFAITDAMATTVGASVTIGSNDTLFFSDIAPGDSIEFDADIRAACSVSPGATNIEIEVFFDTLTVSGMSSLVSGTSTEVTSSDLTIDDSTVPAALQDQEFGDTVGIFNIEVENNGNAGEDSIFYCVRDLEGVTTIDSILLNGNSLPFFGMDGGFSCFLITDSLPPGATLNVSEFWTVTGCTMGLAQLNRRVQFGCLGNMDCENDPNARETEFSLVTPPSTTSLSIDEPTVLSKCGTPDTFFIEVANNSTTQEATNVRTILDIPSGGNNDISDFMTIDLLGGATFRMGSDTIDLPNIPAGDTISAGFILRAKCTSISADDQFRFTVVTDPVPCAQSEVAVATTMPVSIREADLSIPTINPSIIDAYEGLVDSVTVTVANGGNGALDSMFYCVEDKAFADLLSVKVAGIDLLEFNDASSATPGFTCFVVDSAVIAAALGAGNDFVQTTMDFVEVYEFTTCVSNPPDLRRRPQYGCFGDYDCQNKSQNEFPSTGVTFGTVVPDVNTQLVSVTRPACFTDDTSFVQLYVINQGNAPATSINFQITSSSSNSLFIGNYEVREKTGDTLIADQTIEIINAETGCSSPGTNSIQDTIKYRLEAGDTLVLNYAMVHACDCVDDGSVNNVYNSTPRVNGFVTTCGNLLNNASQFSTGDFDASITSFVEGPQELSDGETGLVEYPITAVVLDWFTNAYQDAFIESYFILPAGLDYVSMTANWEDPQGDDWAPTSVIYTDNGTINEPDTIIARWAYADLPVGFNISSNSSISFNIQQDCSEKPVFPDCSQVYYEEIISQNTYLSTADTCTNCPALEIWSPEDLDIRLYCPAPGCENCDGIIYNDLTIERVSYGLADNNNDNNPNGTLDTSLIQKDRFLQGDSLKALFQGTVSDPTPSENWEYAFATIDFPNSNYLPLSATVMIFDSSAMTSYTCNGVPLTPSDTLLIADISRNTLNNFGCALPGGFTFGDGDSISLCIFFKVTDAYSGSIPRNVRFETEFYVSDAAYGMGMIGQCNDRFARLSQVGITRSSSRSFSNWGGCNNPNWSITESIHYGASGFDEFPYEVRQLGIPKTLTFTKPSEFSYQLDRLGLTLTQNISGNNVVNVSGSGSDTIPGAYLSVSGNQLTFDAEGYFNSLMSSLIPPDEGFTFVFRPRVQGGCSSMPGSYSVSYDQEFRVDEQIFFNDIYDVAPNMATVNYTSGPQLDVIPAMDTISVCGTNELISVRVDNQSSVSAPNAYVYINSPSGGVIINGVFDVDTNEIAQQGFGVYPIGNLAGNASRDILISVSINDCSNEQLDFIAGWDCQGYPATVEEATCSDPSTIELVTAGTGLNFVVREPVVDSVRPLCQEIQYELEIISTDLGFLRDIELYGYLPPNETFVPGSLQFAKAEVVSGSTVYNYSSISDPTSIPGGFRLNVSQLDGELDTVGLVGSKDLQRNKVRIRFQTETDCGFISGSRGRFLVEGSNSCGDPIRAVKRLPAKIRVTNQPPNFNINASFSNLTANPCNQQVVTSIATLALSSGNIQPTDSVSYTLPPGVTYVPGSYIPILNATNQAPNIRTVGGIQVLSWPLRTDVSPGSDISFRLRLVANDVGQLCANYDILIQAYSQTSGNCGALTCDIGVTGGDALQQFNIVKPQLSFTDLDANITLDANTNTGLAEVSATIFNSGALLQAGRTITVDIYEDTDLNGVLSSADDSLFSITYTLPSPLANGQSVTLTDMASFPAGSVCKVIGVLNPDNTCTCDLETSNQTEADIIIDFDHELELCSGDTIEMGPNLISGYDFEWVSVNGSAINNVLDRDTTPTEVTIVNTSGSNQITRYALRSSTGTCYEYDTVAINVFPSGDDMVNVQACEGSSFTLPVPSDNGTNYNWTPSAGISFSGPGNKYATVDNVMPGSVTYTLNYTDENSCSVEFIVVLEGTNCGGANTAIGDTVWFDQNSNGLFDMGEPGISGIQVNLYNATNGNPVSSTQTDANGFYIFDTIPQGTYYIEFVTIPGFNFTNANIGANDTLDSDANGITGITGNYYLPLGTYNPTVDAGFVSVCDLDLELNVSNCQPDAMTGTQLVREVTAIISWSENPYTYDQFNGEDTIELTVGSDMFTIIADTLSGSDTIVYEIPSNTSSTFGASATFTVADNCMDNVASSTYAACEFDLALKKQIETPGPYSYGDTVQFSVIIYNQGVQAVENVIVRDYASLSDGYEFINDLNVDWGGITSGDLISVITTRLENGESDTIPLFAELVMADGADDWTNIAEISYFEDTLGNDRSAFDIDSEPDTIPSNDAGGEPGTASDNSINGDGTGTPGSTSAATDEDDHDPAYIEIFDLALTKELTTPPPYDYGQTVTFTITVYNQGNVSIDSIALIDYIPDGFSLSGGSVPPWTFTANGAPPYDIATDTFNVNLLPGGSVSRTIDLTIERASEDQYVNIAEITYARDNSGVKRTDDIDSSPDTSPDDDAGGVPNSDSDNFTRGDGTGMPNSTNAFMDEDDQDPAALVLPQITLVKSVDTVVAAMSGTDGNFDVTYSFVVTNTGNVDLTDIQLSDDFSSQIGTRFVSIVTDPFIANAYNTDTVPTLDPNYNGAFNENLFIGDDGYMEPNDSFRVELVLELTSQQGPTPIVNEGQTSGVDTVNNMMVNDSDTAITNLPGCYLGVICPGENQGVYDCLSEVPAAANTVAEFNAIDNFSQITDTCGTITITSSDVSNGSGCGTDTLQIVRTYIIEDAGDGNFDPPNDTCVVNYYVVDNEGPNVVCPGPLSFSCNSQVPTPYADLTEFISAGGVANDNCGIVSFGLQSETSMGTCPETITRTYVVTDNCGNSTTCNQVITVNDEIAPQLSCLPIDTACLGTSITPYNSFSAFIADGNTATDNCGVDTATFTYLGEDTLTFGCPLIIERTYQIADSCGNLSCCGTQLITYEDVVNPVLESAPADTTIDCDAIIPSAPALAATDNCSTPSVNFFEEDNQTSSGICNDNSYTITRTWVAEDACGNQDTSVQMITIQDTTAPTAVCMNIVLDLGQASDCEITIQPSDIGGSSFDNCTSQDDLVLSISQSTFNADDLGFNMVTLTVEDACGNTSTCMTTVEVQYNYNMTAEFINCPTDTITVGNDFSNCSGGVNWSQPIAQNNCGIDSVVQTTGPAPGQILPVGVYDIQYQAFFNGVSVASCAFVVEVTDVQQPFIACPQDITIGTDAGVCEWASTAGSLSPSLAIENCEPSLTYEVTNPDGSVVADSGDVSGYVFVLGLSTVEYTLTDSSGTQVDSCSFNVTVVDDESPQITCPADATFSTAAGSCDTLVNLAQPGFSDNCSSVADSIYYTVTNPDNSVSGPFGGSTSYLFELGNSQVEWKVTDTAGNTDICIQNITIEDNELPTISCAADMTVSTDAGACSYRASGGEFDPLSVSDNCPDFTLSHDVAFAPNSNTLNGADLPTGTTVVTWTVTDASGNTATCVMSITVEDNEAPSFVNCPVDTITVGNDFSNCSGGVNWSQPVADDNCGVDSVAQTAGPAPGQILSVGTYAIQYVAYDEALNTDTCDFIVEVTDVQQPFIGCPQDITIGTDAGVCEWASTAGSLTPSVAIENCEPSLTYEVTNPDGSVVADSGDVSGYVFVLGVSTVEYTLTDSSGTQVDSCSFSVTVVDDESPQITCPADATFSTAAGSCDTMVSLAQPGFSDNCSSAADSIYYTVTNPDNSVSGPFGGSTAYLFELGNSQVEWTVTDTAGNTDVCIQNITIEDNELPTISCAADMTVSTDAGACSYRASGGEFDPLSVSDNCPDFTLSHDVAFAPNSNTLNGADLPTGTTVVTWTVTDGSGNTATCVTSITVEDNEAPSFVNCPVDTITVGNDFSNCSGGVNWSQPIAEDNCGVDSVVQTAGPAPGQILSVGTYAIQYVAYDAALNTDTCDFIVEVTDVQQPFIGCPQDITIGTDAGVCEWASTAGSLTPSLAIENCEPSLTYEVTNPDGSVVADSGDVSGYVFVLGVSTVEYTLTDSSGTQVDSCSLNVTVVDDEDPQITCPADATFSTAAGSCDTLMSLAQPAFSDNCSANADSIYYTVTNPDNSVSGPFGGSMAYLFELGNSQVEWTVTDTAGNTDICIQNITIEDNELPTISCAADMTVSTDAGACSYRASGGEFDPVSVSDNCPDFTLSHDVAFAPNSNTLNGTDLPTGTTVVTWTVMDGSGNTATCVMSITVEDNEAPSFVNCPVDTITVGNDFTNCSGGVNWSQPIAEDNCGLDSVVQTAGPTPGQILSVGTYAIQYVAYDEALNTDTCDFIVEVTDVQQPFIGCPQDITIGTDAGACEWASITGSLTPSLAIENCEPSLTHEVMNPDGSVVADSGDVSGYVFVLGTSIVQYTLTDSSGTQIDSCSFNVTVIDDEDPVITCPADTVYGTNIGLCTRTETLVQPGFSDNCSSAPDSVYYFVTNPDNTISGPFAGGTAYTFDEGNNIVEWTVVDSAGNTDQCFQNVEVEDIQTPTLVCAPDATVNTDTADCTYLVTGGIFDPLIATDNCPDFTVSHDLEIAPNTNTLNGTYLPVGTYEVTWTVMDEQGNTSICNIMITVEDNESPSFVNCPLDTITVGNDFSNCSGGVNWSQPVAEDNCNVDSVNQITGPAPGQILAVGSYTITYVAYDPSLNTDTCTFIVDVQDVQQPFIGCPQDITIGTDAGVCEWASTANSLSPSVAIENCEPSLTHEVTNPDGSVVADSGDVSGYVFVLGVSTVEYTLTDSSGTQVDSCSFNVTVVDDEDPQITCPLDIVTNTATASCDTLIDLVEPGFSDNCSMGPDSLYFVVTNPDNSVSGPFIGAVNYLFDLGTSQVKWTVVDTAGNTASCIQNVTVVDNEIPMITCPANDTLSTSDDAFEGVCGVISDFELPVISDNCEITLYNYAILDPNGSLRGPFDLTSIKDLPAASLQLELQVGTSQLSFFVEDQSGNTNTCSYLVTIEDDEDPSFVNCPTSDTLTVSNFIDGCSGSSVWSIPIAEDNCPGVIVTQTQGPASGSVLPVGFYDIQYIAEDAAGNMDTCEFVLRILDTQNPMIACPSNDVVASTDLGECTWTSPDSSLSPIVASDNCPIEINWTVTNPDGSTVSDSGDVSGYTFNSGISEVCYVITETEDPSNDGFLSDTCCFTVIVEDRERPEIFCPADVTFNDVDDNIANCVYEAVGTALDATATDNCSITSITHDYEAAPDSSTLDGAVFPLGTTVVTWTATDTAGNRRSCEFTITVIEEVPPMINCLSDTTILTSSGVEGDCKGQFEWTHPIPTDNCEVTEYTVRYINPDGTIDGPYGLLSPDSLQGNRLFELGTTTVTYYVADQSGNETQCSFNVTVEDDEAPFFINCPRPAVIENAEFEECGAYVNFSLPLADDNCQEGLTVIKVDDTGLNTGDRFPVGTTILKWIAEDAQGNQSDTCMIKVVVNDRQAPYIECPSDTTGIPNDPGLCGAVVNDIEPDSLTDNCIDNTFVVYGLRQLSNPSGTVTNPDSIISAGFDDASGNFFDVGVSEVTYCATDRPLLIITEVTQSAANGVEGENTSLPAYVTGPDDADYIEVTNFGPNAVDISCLGIEKLPGSAAGNGSIIIPEGIVMQPGDVMVIHTGAGMDDPANLYFNLNAGNAESGAATGYTLSFEGNILDAVALNGFDPVNLGNLAVVQSDDWSGTIPSTFNTAGIKRIHVFDTNTADDFTVISDENPGSIGAYNANYPAAVDRGNLVSLQNTDINRTCCTFEVEVLDVEPPMITCPVSVQVPTSSNGEGDCTGEYTWNHPIPTDNCEIDSFTVSFLNPDGSVDGPFSIQPDSQITRTFDLGETVVQYYVDDPSGNLNGCEFSVTVIDDEAPVIACPGDMTLNLDPGECRVAVSFLLDSISENCGIDTIISTPPAGSFFEIGITDVHIVVIDDAGLSDTCSFQITVNEFVPSNATFVCNDFLQISLDENCEASISAATVLEGSNYGCYDHYGVLVTDMSGNEVDPLLGLDDVGDTLRVTITDPANGNTCTTLIFVEDKLKPEVACPADTVLNCNISTDPAFTGSPELLSCEGSVIIEYDDELIYYGECADTLKQIIRTWTITDESNNRVSCTQNIYIRGFVFDQLRWPEQFDGTDNVAFGCAEVAANPSLLHPSNTGYPMIDDDPIFGNHHCEIFVGYEDRVLQDANCPAGYEIFRSWLVRDMCQPIIEDENPREYLQVIRVQDKTAPEFTVCPDTIVVPTLPNTCGTFVNFDNVIPEVLDDCSGIMNINVVTPPYAVGNFFQAGTHTIEFVAMDSCYNVSRCRTKLEIKDQWAPVPICDQNTKVSLSDYPDGDPNDGVARVRWETFNDGSYDNCAIDRIQVRRVERGACDSFLNFDDRLWKDYEEFCCEDIANNPIMIEMGVWDIYGNFNSCMVEVTVEDKIRPSITPPQNLTLSCTYDFDIWSLTDPNDPTFGRIVDRTAGGARQTNELFDRDLEVKCNNVNPNDYDNDPYPSYVFQDGLASDNCFIDTIEIRIRDERNNCGVGNLVREFIVRDIYGNQTPVNPNNPFTKIEQIITFRSCDPFTENDIIWPRHYDGATPSTPILTCEDLANDSTSADPTAQGSGIPRFRSEECATLAIRYEDEIFDVVPDACYKIFRHWEVLDWCQYDDSSNPPAGLWEYTQVIKVKDTEAPLFTGCSDITICDSLSTDCYGLVEIDQPVQDCTPDEFLKATFIIEPFNNDNDPSDDIVQDEDNGLRVEDGVISIAVRLPVGTHKISWIVEDMCGQVGTCEYLITVEDCKIPTPYCLNGVATVVMPSIGEIEIWASDLDAGSVDNCDELQFSFTSNTADSGMVISCEDLQNGMADTFEVDMWVTDRAGNQDYCQTYIIVQDPNDVCPDTANIVISGQTLTSLDEGVENVEVRIDNPNVPTPQLRTTDASGSYRFLAGLGQDYEISAFKNDDPLNGVSTWDITIMQMHILGLSKLEDPYQLIAANINDDGRITGTDLIELRKVILGIEPNFPENQSWRFVDATASLPAGVVPESFDEVISLQNVWQDRTAQDFVAVKVGDLNNTVVPNTLIDEREVVSRNAPLTLEVLDKVFEKGDEVRMELTAAQFENVMGYQMTMNYDRTKLDFMNLEADALDMNESNIGVFENTGQLTMSWNAVKGLSVKDGESLFTLVFRATDEVRLSEVFHMDGSITPVEAYVNGEIQNMALRFTDRPVEFALYQNIPNPFTDKTVIGFNLPYEADADIIIYDVSGKVVRTISGSYTKGYNQVSIDHIDLPGSGLYYYELISGEFRATKKMIYTAE